MAASFGPWAGLPWELLRVISDGFGLPLQSYCSIRGVCTAWRAALRPPVFQLLLTVSGFDAPRQSQVEAGQRVSALLLSPEPRWYHDLSTLPVGGDFVGSSNGWIAVNNVWPGIHLVNPLAEDREEIVLRTPRLAGEPVSKIVFAPNPTPEDSTAVAICGPSRLGYARTSDRKSAIMDVAVEGTDELADLAYDIDGAKVYCVTKYGDVHVFMLPSEQRRIRPRVNTLQPRRAGVPLNAATVFAPPYDVVSRQTGAKNIFLCDGSLYQVWRNNLCAVSLRIPGGTLFRMAKNDMFVLKHGPRRRPCWDAVNDLGGFSVFIGKTNPVVLRPEDAPGVRADCVYWIKDDDERSRPQPMVFDIPEPPRFIPVPKH